MKYLNWRWNDEQISTCVCVSGLCVLVPQNWLQLQIYVSPTQLSLSKWQTSIIKNGKLRGCWMNNFSKMLLPQCNSNRHAQFIHAGELKWRLLLNSPGLLLHTVDQISLIWIIPILLCCFNLRVYPSETCGVVLVKLSDTTAPLLINNKLWALHCIFVQILLRSPQTFWSIIGFAFTAKLTF